MLKASAGMDLTHVPYKGFGQAVVDVVACNVDLLFGSISAGVPHIRAGKLKAIAVTIPKRQDAYFGIVAPAGTPRSVIDTYIVEILKEKDTASRLSSSGLDLVGSSPETFAARIAADLEKYAGGEIAWRES